jgi:serine/threonine protein kinase
MTERQTTKFLKELESQASLQHPNCVRVFAVCLEKNNVFIMMEWMYGGSLWERLQQLRENSLAPQHNCAAGGLILSARMRLKIARDICHGLQYMHSRGMVHGDIKSLNVLLDRDNNAKLCDFGCTSVRNLQTSSTILAVQTVGQNCLSHGVLLRSCSQIIRKMQAKNPVNQRSRATCMLLAL